MSDSTEKVRLEFEVDDAALKRAQATVVSTTHDTYDFADAYELVEQTEMKAAGAIDATTQALGRQASAQTVVSAGATKVATATASVAKGGIDVGNAALQAARGLEDLQYGIGGIVNNVPGFVMAMGGSMGMAAALNLTMVGVNQLVKHWPDLMNLFREHHEIPKAADAVERLTDELKSNNKELDKLKEMTSLTNEQLARFNTLTSENVRLEKEKADALARQKALKEFLNSKSKDEKGIGAGFSAATAGRGEETLKETETAMKGESEDAIRSAQQKARNRIQALAMSGKSLEEQAPEQKQIMDELQSFIERERGQNYRVLAEDLIVKIKAGDEAAFAYFRRLAASGYKGANMMDVSIATSAESPEGKKKTAAAAKAAKKKHDDFWTQEVHDIGAEASAQKAIEDAAWKKQVKDVDEEVKVRDRAKKLRDQQTRAQVGRQVKREDAAIAGSGLVQQAEAMMLNLKGQMDAKGSVTDKFGNEHAMSDEQIFNFVRQSVTGEVQRREYQRLKRQGGERDANGQFHRMSDRQMTDAAKKGNAGDIGMVVAARAQKDLGEKMTAMSATGLTNQEKHIQITQTLMNQMAALQAKAAQQSRQLDGMQAKTRTMQRRAN